MKNFIDPQRLKELEGVILADVRFDFTDPEDGRRQYEKEHLEGAHYLDLEEDLSSPRTEDSGNHPMPDAEKLKKKLESLGASTETLVVVYDDGSNLVAGRAWFVMKHLGMKNVKVLNGGFAAAKKAGLSMSREIPPVSQPGEIHVRIDDSLLAAYEEVLEHSRLKEEGRVLVDARILPRYEGREEHLYAVAGHIPGAENLPYMEPYDEEGRILSEEKLKKLFSRFENKRDVILSCGSGVSAAANFVAMDEIGMKPRLFIGSYSQWLRKGNRVE